MIHKEENIPWFFCLILFLALIGVTSVLNHQVNQTEMYKTKFLQTQNYYEGTRDQLASVEFELEKKKYELAQAQARERAANLRATRSRTFDSKAGVRLPERKDSFDGRLYDITKYCPTGNRTASGKWPREGMVATISRAIPFGTRVQIAGLGTYVVEDRIGHGSEFDIFTPSCAEAEQFGRQHRAVRILE